MIISCSIVVRSSRRSSCAQHAVRIARKPFWLSLRRHPKRQLMQAVMNELPASRKNSSKPPCSSLEPPRSRDAVTWSAASVHDRLDQQRDVLRIVRAVGVEEHRDRRADVRDGPPHRLALAAPAIGQHDRAPPSAATSAVPSVDARRRRRSSPAILPRRDR